MNQKDLEYLRKMEEEAAQRAFSKEEIEEIHNCLRTNVDAADTDEALNLSASIAEAQVESFGTDVDSLLNTILYHGDLKGAEEAVYKATETKFALAAHFIDSEQYDKFEDMLFEDINKKNFEYHVPYKSLRASGGMSQTPYIIMDEVKTLKGAQYLVLNGKVPHDYFTDDSRHSIEKASIEQLKFYVEHGSNINAVIDAWEYGYDQTENRSLLDKYIMDADSQSLEYMKEIIKLGGKRADNELIHDTCNYYTGQPSGLPMLDAKKMLLLNDKGMLSDSEKHSVRKSIKAETDYLEWKKKELHEKLGDKVGKTADAKTGQKTDEHREIANAQVKIAKEIMLQERINKRKDKSL